MDEKLMSTINKIKQLAEQKPEFKQVMQKLFGNTVSASSYSNYDKRIAHIEEYLGLDYYTDSMPSVITKELLKKDFKMWLHCYRMVETLKKIFK